MAVRYYYFGNMVLNSDTRVLTKPRGEEVSFEPKECAALVEILKAGEDGISKERLREALWPPGEVHVDPDALRTVIYGARKKLGDAGPFRFIGTISGFGFRFLLPVTTGVTASISQGVEPPKGVPPPPPTSVFLGRTSDIGRIHVELRKANGRVPLVVVHGVPGVGKTTLSQAIAHDAGAMEAFPDGVLWTSLAQKPVLVNRMAEWGGHFLDNGFLGLPTVSSARTRLSHHLRTLRMLLIVDDVWEARDATPFIQAAGEACGVLVTTRQSAIGTALASENATSVRLAPLSLADAFDLLTRLAPGPAAKHREDCELLLEAVGRLPLAIHVAGRLLSEDESLGAFDLAKALRSAKDSRRMEKRILGSEPPPIMESAAGDSMAPEEEKTINELFAKSTKRLEPVVRRRLANLGSYARTSRLSLETLARLWDVNDPLPTLRALVAHGLLEPRGDGSFYLHEMIAAHARSLGH